MEQDMNLALIPQRELSPALWKMISDMAPVMYKSRLFGVTSAEAAAAIMLKGFEMGLGLAASFEFIQVVQGKASLSPRGALGLLHNSPVMAEISISQIIDQNEKFIGYECRMKRKNGFAYTSRFTMEDARQAGVIKPDSGWQHYPQNMCLWRAVGFCADVVAPDVVGGLTAIMKMPENFGIALSEAGDVIDVVPNAATASASTQAPAQNADAGKAEQVAGGHPVTLDELLSKYDPDMILVANEGRMPMTDEEIAHIAQVLGGEA